MLLSQFYSKYLPKLNSSTSLLDLDLIVSHVLNISRERLFIIKPSFNLSDDILAKLDVLLSKYLQGEPIAYLTNNKEFYSLDFYVDHRALIPRPETEKMVDLALGYLDTLSKDSFNVIDIGTGCGAVGLSIKYNSKSTNLILTDISQDALDVAKFNSSKLNLETAIVVSDLFEKFNDKYFDVITSNLPYIGTDKNNFVSKATYDYEPHIALFGGEDGLDLYDIMFKQLIAKNVNFGILIGEFGFTQQEKLQVMINEYFPDMKVTFYKDLAGYDRIFKIES